jgi:hypothetical protein
MLGRQRIDNVMVARQNTNATQYAVCFEQTFDPPVANSPWHSPRNFMFTKTSAQCRERAKQKLAQAERDKRHSRRLIDAAQAWLLIASNLRRMEVRALRVPSGRPLDQAHHAPDEVIK